MTDRTLRDAQRGFRDRRAHNRRRWLLPGILIGILVLLVILELIARLVVGRVAAGELEKALPEEFHAEVQANPTGWCVLCELLGGELSGLDVTGENVQFGEANGTVEFTAQQLGLSDPITVGSVAGTLQIGEQELNELFSQATAGTGFEISAVDLRDGGFGYETTLDVFGAQVEVAITADVRLLSGGRLQILAQDLAVRAGPLGADIPVDADRFSLQFCIAEYLPELLQITSVKSVEGSLEIGYRTTHAFTMTPEAFETLGSCPAS